MDTHETPVFLLPVAVKRNDFFFFFHEVQPKMIFVVLLGTCLLSSMVRADAQNKSSAACARAVGLTEFVFEQLNTNPEASELVGNGTAAYEASQPVTTDQLQYMPQVSFAAYQVEALLSAANYGGGQAGEIFNVLNRLNGTERLGDVARFSGDNLTEAYTVWALPWIELADGLIDRANEIDSSGSMAKIKADMLFRASQYLFVANWPFPVSEQSLEAAKKSRTVFLEYLQLKAETDGYTVLTDISIPYSNGTVDVNLPAVFVTPDPTKRLPLIILNTGTDYPIAAIWPVGGADAVKNGYAVLAFEGPGQGDVKRYAPYMPLVPRWDTVIDAVLTSISEDARLENLVSSNDTFLMGVSLGGYLVGQACSMLEPGKLKGCIVTPAVTSMLLPYNERFASTFYLPFANYTSLPAEYASALQSVDSVIEQVLRPLLLECDEDSGARQLWYELFSSQSVSEFPDIVYNVIDYGGGGAGFVNTSLDAIVDASYDSWGKVFNFVNPNVSSTSTPVLVLAGSQDVLMGGQQNAYFDQLPEAIKEKSKLVVFDAESGGALHCQVGAMGSQAEVVVPWVESMLSDGAFQLNSNPSLASSMATSVLTSLLALVVVVVLA